MITKETLDKYRLENKELHDKADSHRDHILDSIANSIDNLLTDLEKEL